MKKIFAIVLLFTCMNIAQAQLIKAYLSGGVTASQIDGDELKGFKKWGGTGGVGAMITLSDNAQWKLGIEANFSQRGARNVSRNPYNIRLNLNYVDIPLMLYFRDPYGGITIGAGLMYGRLVQQPHDTIFYGPAFIPDTSNMSFLMNDLAFAAELRFKIWKGLSFSLRWHRSLLPIKNWGFTEKGEYWTNDCFNSSLSGRLIWQFGDPDDHPRHKAYHKKNYHRHRR